jgi:hypothetical protein
VVRFLAGKPVYAITRAQIVAYLGGLSTTVATRSRARPARHAAPVEVRRARISADVASRR